MKSYSNQSDSFRDITILLIFSNHLTFWLLALYQINITEKNYFYRLNLYSVATIKSYFSSNLSEKVLTNYTFIFMAYVTLFTPPLPLNIRLSDIMSICVTNDYLIVQTSLVANNISYKKNLRLNWKKSIFIIILSLTPLTHLTKKKCEEMWERRGGGSENCKKKVWSQNWAALYTNKLYIIIGIKPKFVG